MRLGISIARPNLVSLGTCFGKFSKSGKFKLHITALDYVAQYAKYKVRRLFTFIYLFQCWWFFQDLDKAQRRDAFSIWKPCRESTSRKNNRWHARASGSSSLQHEWYTFSMSFRLYYPFPLSHLLRVLELLLGQRLTHENWTQQQSLFSIKRTLCIFLRRGLGLMKS